MPTLVVLLDELGIEVARGSTVGRELRLKGRNMQMAIIRPVQMDTSSTDAIKGAAWGLLLAGPLGAAVGTLIGGGPRVAFELDTDDGETLRCVARRSEYLAIKRDIETAFVTEQRIADKRRRWETQGRTPSVGLIVGMVLLPPVFVWFFLRKHYRWVARGLATAWTVLWLIFVASVPRSERIETPSTPSGVVEGLAASEAADSGQSSPAPISESRSLSFDACNSAINDMSGQIGVRPLEIVNTQDVRTVRMLADDGSVLITCSKPDRRMVVTRSVRRE